MNPDQSWSDSAKTICNEKGQNVATGWYSQLHSNLVHTISDPKGTHMSCLGVIQRCIKTHLYSVAFISMCNFCHCIWVFIFYFISIVYYVISQLSACTSDTCILKDQSINQSINQSIVVVDYKCRQPSFPPTILDRINSPTPECSRMSSDSSTASSSSSKLSNSSRLLPSVVIWVDTAAGPPFTSCFETGWTTGPC